MTLTELLPSIQALPRAEKLRLIQVLATDIADEETHDTLPIANSESIWTPYDAHAAAATLLQLLQTDQAAMK